MKKFLIVFILALCVAIPGCKKDPVFYTITSSVSGGGTIDPLGISSVEAGSSIIYTIKPDANYSISSIKVDGIDYPVSNTIEIKNVSSNTEIKVEFTINTFTITASADFGVVLDPKGVFTVASGDSMKFSFSMMPDRSIKSIQINGNAVNTYPNQNYVLEGNNIYIKVKEDASLKIQSISNDSLYIMSSTGWYLQEFWTQDLRDSSWHEMAPEDSYFREKLVFTDFAGGSATYYDENNKIYGGPYIWSIEGKKLDIANLTYTIVYLDSKKLVLDEILNDGAYLSRKTYTHIAKKL